MVVAGAKWIGCGLKWAEALRCGIADDFHGDM